MPNRPWLLGVTAAPCEAGAPSDFATCGLQLIQAAPARRAGGQGGSQALSEREVHARLMWGMLLLHVTAK